MASYNLVNTASYYNGSTIAKDQDGQLIVAEGTVDRLNLFPKNRTGGFPRTLFNTPLFYNGTTSAKDQDGQLLLGPELVDRPCLLPVTKVPGIPRLIVFSPLYYDGVTTGKDIDGELILDTDTAERGTRFTSRYIKQLESSVSGSATASSTARTRFQASASVSGEATAAGLAILRLSAAAVASGSSSAVAAAIKRLQAEASASGSSSATGSAVLILSVSGTCTIVLYGTGELTEAVLGEDLPNLVRQYFSGEALAPQEAHTISEIGDVSVTNKLTVASSSSLALAAGYSGVAYSFEGPADSSAAPYKLGFVRGDKIKLYGPLGTEPNHGKIVTFEDPASVSILELLTTPDTTEYEFVVFRRLT